MDIKKFVLDYLNTGVNETHDPEVSQQMFVTNLFGLIGYTTCFLTAASALFRSDWLLAGVLLLAGGIFFSSNLILRSTLFRNPYKFSSLLVTTSLMILMLYLIFTGGVNGTGPLWIYIVPPMTLFFGGMKKGSISLGLFITVITVMMFYPEDKLLSTTYTYEFKSRLLYSFLTVSSLFAFYEYARQSSFRRMREMSDEFEKQAMHDPLSGLLNRRGMLEELQHEFDRSIRYAHPLTLVMCDIDHFKKVNDEYGHDKGDEIIHALASLFKSNMRKHDAVARWGGEEYLLLLPETTGKQGLQLAENLREKIENTQFKDKDKDKSFHVTVSFGLYQIANKDTIDQAINQADKNLYQAKEQGRNRCILG